jgi:MoaA/NifB/PqqE/SkfB family radical SAM enzyme
VRKITEKIDAITRIPDNYRIDAPPCPKSVKIELTGRCNYACTFCARSHKLRNQQDMAPELYAKILGEMREAGVEELGVFYLGESFLCAWLPEAIRVAKQEFHFPYVFLTSNASISTPERVKDCMEAGLDSLKWSYNYADEAQFVDVAQVKPKLFERMKENIKAAHKVRRKGGYTCGLYASYIEYDGEQGERMKEAVAEIEPFVDEIYALPLYSHADFCTKDEKDKGWAPNAGNIGRIGALREPLPCWTLFTEAHITWDGQLVGCCFAHTAEFEFADLTEVSFMEGWHSEKALALRRAHLIKDVRGTACENCVAYA